MFYAKKCLRKVQSRITTRDQIPSHYLLRIYGSVSNKEEIYRIWNVYKAVFPSIPNLGYHAIISSLLSIGDIEGAEMIYEEWLPVKSSYDPRILNLFMDYYVKNRNLEKAMSFLDRIVVVGGKPNSGTLETLAEALFYWNEAFAANGVKNWRLKAANMSAFLDLCDQEADLKRNKSVVPIRLSPLLATYPMLPHHILVRLEINSRLPHKRR